LLVVSTQDVPHNVGEVPPQDNPHEPSEHT